MSEKLDQKSHSEEVLQALLKDHPKHWDWNLDQDELEKLLETLRIQCLLPLFFHQYQSEPLFASAPQRFQEKLREEYQNQLVIETVRQAEFVDILTQLREKNIPCLTLKGAALAHSVYAESCLRPRGDTDLWIRLEDREEVRQILKSLGYEFNNMTSGTLINHQDMAAKKDAMAIAHIYDVHWKLSNPQAFSELLTFKEAFEASNVISIGSEKVNVLCAEHALLYACVHRVAHHHNDEKLIWLYDIQLLLNELGKEGFERFCQLAAKKEMRAVCLQGLQLAQKHLGTHLPQDLMKKYFSEDSLENQEASSDFLEHQPRRIDVMVSDFWALPNWKLRFRLVKEHAFPSADFMMRRFKFKSWWLLPFFYIWRILQGIHKLFYRF